MNPSPRTNDLLDRHGAFVRRLASQLTRCDADADDLAQSTWTEALVRPPQEWVSPRGWLARVTHRLAAKGRRSERRRAHREEQVARAEQVDVDMDLSPVLGELASALGDLDAGQRRVLIGRHFEGLDLRALAVREKVGLTTIKVRLAAAHEALRRRLDRAHGGDRKRWLGALMPLTIVPLPATPLTPSQTNSAPATTASLPSLAAGVLAVSTSLKFLITMACVGALIFGLTRSGGDAQLAPELAPISAELPAQDEPVADVAAPMKTAERMVAGAVEVEGGVIAQSAGSMANILFVISDLYGAAAEGVDVLAAPKGLPLNRVGKTDADGELLLTWEQTGVLEMVVGVQARGDWIGGLRSLLVSASQTRELRMTVHPDLLAPLRSDVVGQLRALVSFELRDVELRLGMIAAETTTILSQDAANGQPNPRRRSPNLATPQQTEDGGPLQFSAHDSSAAGRHQAQSHTAGQLIPLPSDFVVDRSAEPDGAQGKVEGLIQDTTGLPVAHVRVRANRRIAAGTELGALKFTSTEKIVYTDREGRFNMTLPVGDYSLQVGSKRSDERVRVAEGSVVEWNAVVDMGLCLTGQLLLPKLGEEAKDERDSSEFIVEASVYTKGRIWVGVTTTIKDGFFLLPRCPAGSLAVDFSLRGGGELMHHEALATAGAEGWQVALEKDQLTKVSWRPLDDGAGAPCATELLVWDARGERGRQRYMGGRVGEEASIMLPDGAWSLELATAGAVRSSEVRVDVLKGLPVELGPISMGPVGWLVLPASAEGESWLVKAEPKRGPDYLAFEGQVPTRPDGEPMAVALVPGGYRVFLVTEGADAGESTELDLGSVQVGSSEHRRIPAVPR